MYLDDLKDNEQMMKKFIGSHLYNKNMKSTHSYTQITDRSTVHEDDIDDMESGNGPSLPLSPRSVEAVPRPPNSAAAASKRDLALKGSSLHCIDIEFSLCGGLDEPSTFTRALFESGKLSYDDFAARMKIHKDHNLFANPNLVVR